MGQFRVVQTSFIDNCLRFEGDIIDFSGEAGNNLEPVKGKKSLREASAALAAAQAVADTAQATAAAARALSDSNPSDPALANAAAQAEDEAKAALAAVEELQ